MAAAVARFDALAAEAPEGLRVVMLALPVDSRARAACVCPSWRDFLADPSLWQVLDLTPAGGVAAERVTDNLVRGAARRAARQLREFSLIREPFPQTGIRVLSDVIESDGAELQQVNTNISLSVQRVEAMVAAAPLLQMLNTCVTGPFPPALLPILRNDAPYGRLRVSGLMVDFSRASDADVFAFAAVLAAYEPLNGLNLWHVQFAAGLEALLDAAAERRISWLRLNCGLETESPTLVRLLQRGSLTKLELNCCLRPVPVLCAALRECRALTHLKLHLNPHDGTPRRVVTPLLNAVATLPALAALDLGGSYMQNAAAFGRALGAFHRSSAKIFLACASCLCGAVGSATRAWHRCWTALQPTRTCVSCSADTTTRATRLSATGCSLR